MNNKFGNLKDNMELIAASDNCGETSIKIKLETIENLTDYIQCVFPDDTVFGEDEVNKLAERLCKNITLTEIEKKEIINMLPLEFVATNIASKELPAGEEWNLSDSYGGAVISLQIDELKMGTGSCITCEGKSLDLTVNNLIKIHTEKKSKSENIYDIGILGRKGIDGSPGTDGTGGAPGADGKNGKEWSPGIAGDDGGKGGDGAPGKSGLDGNPGTNGSGVVAYTIVIKNITEPITIYAMPGKGGNGGAGGAGGDGGTGGKGGNGCDTGCEGSNGGDGGNGGAGGNGGSGGDGGDGGSGGTVNVYVKPGTKKFIRTITENSEGGLGGTEGIGGKAGAGGGKGNGGKHHNDGNPGSNSPTAGNKGKRGNDGKPGARATINVSEKEF